MTLLCMLELLARDVGSWGLLLYYHPATDLHVYVQSIKIGLLRIIDRTTRFARSFTGPSTVTTVSRSALKSTSQLVMCRLPMTSNQCSQATGRLKPAVNIFLQRPNNIRGHQHFVGCNQGVLENRMLLMLLGTESVWRKK